MAPKGSATTTPTIPSNSPAPLSGTQAASGGTPARSTSPSKLCGDRQSFQRWLAAYNVKRREAIGHPPELIDVNATGQFPIKIPNALHPPTTNPKVDALYEELRNMFTLDDALEDEYGIHQNAYLLCRSYARSKRVMEDSIEAHLRSPIDDVLQVVFEEEGRLHYEEEVAMVLPRRSESMRKALGLATQSTAHMDTAIAGLAYYNVADEQEWEVFNHPELHAFHIRTQACDDGSDDNPPHRIALLDLGWEYTMVEAPTVRNQTVLNTAISLLHRQYVDMKSRPLWGFAVCYRTVKFYTTEWEGDIPIIREWTDELTLHTFKDWVRLYIMLVHIRKKIQGYPPPNININAALRRPAWRYPEANTKRGPSTDLSSENPPKKPKLFPGPGSASGSPMGGGGGRGGMADDESPRDSDVSMPTTPETEQIHAPVPVRLADQHSMRSFRLDAETLGKEHAVQDGMDVVYV